MAGGMGGGGHSLCREAPPERVPFFQASGL